MTQTLFGYALTSVTVILVLAADYILKHAADAEMNFLSRPVVVGSLIYAISAVLWFFAMRHISLAEAGIAFSMLSMLAICAMGAVFFGERIATREILGIGCAIASMCLMVRVV